MLVLAVLSSRLVLAGPGLDEAEVKLPYGELKSLIAGAVRPVAIVDPGGALLAARFRLTRVADQPVLDATFRTATFADGLAKIPLVGGGVIVESQKPAEARVVVQDKSLCQVLEKAGAQTLELRLLAALSGEGLALLLPPCPAPVFETGDLGEGWSVAVKVGGREQVLGSNRVLALPLAGGGVEIRMLGGEETREALRPPEPSVWTWQHQALVIPGDGELEYRVLASASAAGGSGISAVLELPADAREVSVAGDDLAGHQLVRGADRALGLRIDWKTRGLLERELAISYRLPRRPLDRVWKLQAPAADSTRTRFIVVGSAALGYAADGLAGPFPPKGLPARFVEEIGGASCYQLEVATAATDLTINPLPVVATAEATISEAAWSIRLEPDGAMIVEGVMSLEHRGTLGVPLDIPAGMTLLACEVGGQAVTPVNLGDGRLEITLPAGMKTRLVCSFTARVAALDPVEGTLALSLPKTSLFIRSLIWKIDLPRGYQAETHGNLVRSSEPAELPSRLTLRKNLCRDERPEIQIFYQRSDLKN